MEIRREYVSQRRRRIAKRSVNYPNAVWDGITKETEKKKEITN